MCFAVNLPTVISFLMLYSLRCGCITILFWTLFRSFFCLLFFSVAIAEVFLLRPSPLGGKIFDHRKYPELPEDDVYFCIFYSYITMIVTEAFSLMSIAHFAYGLYTDTSISLVVYLIYRFCTLLLEILFLTLLCLTHKLFIGWYLGFLFFVVLELYSFIVVYSYYTEVKEDEEDDNLKHKECHI